MTSSRSNVAYQGLIIVGACAFLILASGVHAQIRGRILGEDGEPLPGVEVRSESTSSVTDADGNYSLDRGRIIYVWAPGYGPITRLIATVADPVIRLKRDSASVWKAGDCLESDVNGYALTHPNDAVPMDGQHMRFWVPGDKSIEHVSDVDHQENIICIASDCLVHGWGPTWSEAYPTDPAFFQGKTPLTEREIYDVPHDLVWGADYKGARDDGTYVRWVGVNNESIEYDHVRKDSAELFDTIIDSLCWR